MTSEHSTTARWIRLRVNFEEGGNRSTRRKPSKSGWDRLKLNPHTTFVVEVKGVIDVRYASLTSNVVGKLLFAVYLRDMRTYWHLRSNRTIFDKVKEISILLFKKIFTVFLSLKNGTIRMGGGHVVCNCSPWGRVRRSYKQGLTLSRHRKKWRIKICDWHILFGTYILVFDFLLKNYFQSDPSLYPFKKLTRLLSSHLVHLDDLTPASCICRAAPNSCGFSKLFLS